MKTFENGVAVITGAASGFGREFANAGAGLGMRLVLADVQREALDVTVADLCARGVQAVGLVVDVSNGEQVEALAKFAIDTFGAVNLVFNNAGVGSGGLVWENTVKDWEWILGVNLWGVIHGIRVFTPLMIELAKRDANYEGHVVNTASIAGLVAPSLMGAYNVSKHAVVALSETLYHDLATIERPIGCSVLCPAFVRTGISQSHISRPADLRNENGPTASMRAAQAMVDKAVSSGKLSAADIAKITFDAIRNDQFYIITHPKFMASVQMRLEDIAVAQNPRDPFASKQNNPPTADIRS